MRRPINRLILDKLAEREAPDYMKDFARKLLEHEQGSIDQERAPYTKVYKSLLNRYLIEKGRAEKQEATS